MPRDPEKYLYDMLDCCRFPKEFTSGRTQDDYRTDRGFRSAVERELMVIGEAMFQLDRDFPQVAARIHEHQRIISFRHVLVHGYSQLDHGIVWSIIEAKLAILTRDLEAALGASGDADES